MVYVALNGPSGQEAKETRRKELAPRIGHETSRTREEIHATGPSSHRTPEQSMLTLDENFLKARRNPMLEENFPKARRNPILEENFSKARRNPILEENFFESLQEPNYRGELFESPQVYSSMRRRPSNE